MTNSWSSTGVPRKISTETVAKAVAREDLAQAAARDEAAERLVERARERRVVGAHGGRVASFGDVAHDAQARVSGHVPVGDDVVHEHCVGTPALEIGERLVDALVG